MCDYFLRIYNKIFSKDWFFVIDLDIYYLNNVSAWGSEISELSRCVER
jgi:hypothetical protein